MVTNTTYINAEAVCALLRQIAQLGITTPVTLFLDNARYQRCDLVQNLALELGIELMFLPTYSPNLNLIERLWKFVRKKVLYGHYYADFSTFSNAIKSCIHETSTKYADELKTLLTLNFQSFHKCNL